MTGSKNTQTDTQTDTQFDTREFRNALGAFATGVTIITSRNAKGEIEGMTANSFTSISLSPPTILVSMMTGRTLEAILECRQFAVNVLPETAGNLSIHFAGPGLPGFIPSYRNKAGMPRLEDSIAFFDCSVIQTMEVNDHTLVVGNVTECECVDNDPLIFYSSQYHILGEKLAAG